MYTSEAKHLRKEEVRKEQRSSVGVASTHRREFDRLVSLPRILMEKRKAFTLCSTILLGLILVVGWLTWMGYTQRLSKQLFDRLLDYRDARPVSRQEIGLAATITPTQVVWQMLGQVNRDRALDDLRQLTGEEPICVSAGCYTITNRLTGSEGLDWAMDYLYENLANLGYSVELRNWARSGWADQNLIARKVGVFSPTEEIYLVSHVDGVNAAPAADDNGSSVVNGLELARVFSSYSFSRTLVLFFSTGEEQGALGSRAYLDAISPEESSGIQYVINRDMTGYDANGDQVVELFHGGHPPSMALAQMMSETITAYQLDLDQRPVVGCP